MVDRNHGHEAVMSVDLFGEKSRDELFFSVPIEKKSISVWRLNTQIRCNYESIVTATLRGAGLAAKAPPPADAFDVAQTKQQTSAIVPSAQQ